MSVSARIIFLLSFCLQLLASQPADPLSVQLRAPYAASIVTNGEVNGDWTLPTPEAEFAAGTSSAEFTLSVDRAGLATSHGATNLTYNIAWQVTIASSSMSFSVAESDLIGATSVRLDSILAAAPLPDMDDLVIPVSFECNRDMVIRVHWTIEILDADMSANPVPAIVAEVSFVHHKLCERTSMDSRPSCLTFTMGTAPAECLPPIDVAIHAEDAEYEYYSVDDGVVDTYYFDPDVEHYSNTDQSPFLLTPRDHQVDVSWRRSRRGRGMDLHYIVQRHTFTHETYYVYGIGTMDELSGMTAELSSLQETGQLTREWIVNELKYNCSESVVIGERFTLFVYSLDADLVYTPVEFMFFKECADAGCLEGCEEHGTCDEDYGECVCDLGWRGDACQVLVRLEEYDLCPGQPLEFELKIPGDHAVNLDWFATLERDLESYELSKNWAYVTNLAFVPDTEENTEPFDSNGTLVRRTWFPPDEYKLQVFTEDGYNYLGDHANFSVLDFTDPRCQLGDIVTDCSENDPEACSDHGDCIDGQCVCHDFYFWHDCSRGCGSDPVSFHGWNGTVASDTLPDPLPPYLNEADTLYLENIACTWIIQPQPAGWGTLEVRLVSVGFDIGDVLHVTEIKENGDMESVSQVSHGAQLQKWVLDAKDGIVGVSLSMTSNDANGGTGFKIVYQAFEPPPTNPPESVTTTIVEENSDLVILLSAIAGASLCIVCLCSCGYLYRRRMKRLLAEEEAALNEPALKWELAEYNRVVTALCREFTVVEPGSPRKGGKEGDGDEEKEDLVTTPRLAGDELIEENELDAALQTVVSQEAGKWHREKVYDAPRCDWLREQIVSVDKEQLFFGLSKTEVCPVMESRLDQITLVNNSNRTIAYAFSVPERLGVCTCDIRPGKGVIPPGYDMVVDVNFELLMTTALDMHIRLQISRDGTCFWDTPEDLAENVEVEGWCAVRIRLEGELSDRLDPDEVELDGQPLAAGAYGAVYKGVYRGRVVAVKLLKSQRVLTPQQLRDFEREVSIFQKLRNPYILDFVGASFVPNRLCICTVFLRKGSVGDALYSWKLPLALKLRFALNGAKALDFLHRNGVLYRDVKPDNLLVVSFHLTARVSCKLSDFGTSRNVQDAQAVMEYTGGLGTLVYMAPEMLAGDPYNDKADVFSFGSLLYEMLHELVPFSDVSHPWKIVEMVGNGERPKIDKKLVPKPLRILIETCWQQMAVNRPSFAAIANSLDEAFKVAKAELGDNIPALERREQPAWRVETATSMLTGTDQNHGFLTLTADGQMLLLESSDDSEDLEPRAAPKRTSKLFKKPLLEDDSSESKKAGSNPGSKVRKSNSEGRLRRSSRRQNSKGQLHGGRANRLSVGGIDFSAVKSKRKSTGLHTKEGTPVGANIATKSGSNPMWWLFAGSSSSKPRSSKGNSGLQSASARFGDEVSVARQDSGGSSRFASLRPKKSNKDSKMGTPLAKVKRHSSHEFHSSATSSTSSQIHLKKLDFDSINP